MCEVIESLAEVFLATKSLIRCGRGDLAFCCDNHTLLSLNLPGCQHFRYLTVSHNGIKYATLFLMMLYKLENRVRKRFRG